ncbi:TPA: preprotein translocase subunit SecY [Candidatus Uhrbacteria bacterium]|nr:preprotein translocase subunit SecY [Candidatus Uhrbacteria bacterium]
MFEKLKKIWALKPLRKSIGYVIIMLTLFRLLAHIPVPGIDAAALQGLLSGSQFLGLLNIFSGGTLESFSVVALGVAPFITSSIIFQLLVMVIPALQRWQKDGGEAGRQKLNQITRWVSVPLAALQAYGFIALISQGGGQVGTSFSLILSGFSLFMAILVMTAGSVFLMWIGELMTERGIGNGLSILILSGIVAGFPQFLQQFIATFDQSRIVSLVVFLVLAVATVVVVTVINEAVRNIPVNYARHHAAGRLSRGVATQLPLRVSMAGVIPIIFAISVVLFPTMIAQFFVSARSVMVADAARWVIETLANQWVYGILYFVLVFAFTYFYTGVIFRPDEMAENLQKQGAFVPGVRPGEPTERYLAQTMNKILLLGATFLAAIAVLPVAMQPLTGSQSLVVGGTSLLIIVAVIIDVIKQTEAQVVSYEYEQL